MLSECKSLDVLKTILMFAKIFEVRCGSLLIEVKIEDIGADIKSYGFLPEASLTTFRRHIRVNKTILRRPEALLKSIQNEIPEVFGATHLDDEAIVFSGNADTVLLFRANRHYLSNTDRRRGDFPVHTF